MKSIREGGAGEHADYWVFLKSGEEFLAYKVDDWHKFLPAITHKTLDIDQAEEKFLERNKVMNQFALKAQIMSQLKAGEEDGEQSEKPARTLKIKDGYSSSDSDGSEDDRNDEEGAQKKKDSVLKKKKAHEKPKKDKRQRVENGDEVARKFSTSSGIVCYVGKQNLQHMSLLMAKMKEGNTTTCQTVDLSQSKFIFRFLKLFFEVLFALHWCLLHPINLFFLTR
ncbi:unnamed protein product [Strongylus vulgaris]|uniref:Transcription initiation factor IIF subunit alpha n=1 Tax=Strongylus vulgaris TaxID=40348 RepID=A0A3P7K708_STRVU|nr:unnamed protein product [Strongylus vulgaris]